MPFSNGNPNFWPKSCSLTEIWAKDENLNFGFWWKWNYMLKSDIVRILLGNQIQMWGNFWMLGSVKGYGATMWRMFLHPASADNCNTHHTHTESPWPRRVMDLSVTHKNQLHQLSGSSAITHQLDPTWRPKSTLVDIHELTPMSKDWVSEKPVVGTAAGRIAGVRIVTCSHLELYDWKHMGM